MMSSYRPRTSSQFYAATVTDRKFQSSGLPVSNLKPGNFAGISRQVLFCALVQIS